MSLVELKDILFPGLSVTKGRLKYGQIIAYAIQNFQKIKKIYEWNSKWHAYTGLRRTCNLSSSSFFLYLQLRSAILAANILCDRQLITHPIMNLIRKRSGLTKGYVSLIYNNLLEHTQTPLAIKKTQYGIKTALNNK